MEDDRPHISKIPYTNSCATHVYCCRILDIAKLARKSSNTYFTGNNVYIGVVFVNSPLYCRSRGVVRVAQKSPGGVYSMQRNVVRNVLFIATSLALITVSLVAMGLGARAEQNQPKVLSGQVAPLIQQAQLLQTTSSGQQLNLSLGLQPPNTAALNALLGSIYDPQSPQFHQYLTPDQFEALFAPTPDEAQQVVSYLQSQGMTVTGVAPNNLLIDATASVAQADAAFSTTINNYQLGSQVFYANATPPVVPAAISQLITSIGGLDNSTKYQPLYQRMAGRAHLAALANGPTSGKR